LHTAQLMPLPINVSFFSKIQIGFSFLVPAYLGSPGQRAVKRVCVCACVCVCVMSYNGQRRNSTKYNDQGTAYMPCFRQIARPCKHSLRKTGLDHTGPHDWTDDALGDLCGVRAVRRGHASWCSDTPTALAGYATLTMMMITGAKGPAGRVPSSFGDHGDQVYIWSPPTFASDCRFLRWAACAA